MSLLEESRLAATVATQDEDEDGGAIAGQTRGSAKKPRLNEMVADLSTTVEHLGAVLETELKLRKQAVRRAADTRDNISAAVARRSEKAEQLAASSASASEESARAAAAVTAEAAAHERDVAISRADVAEAELRTLRQKLRLAEKKESDPPALKRKDKEICELRAENRTLCVAASTRTRPRRGARGSRDRASRIRRSISAEPPERQGRRAWAAKRFPLARLLLIDFSGWAITSIAYEKTSRTIRTARNANVRLLRW